MPKRRPRIVHVQCSTPAQYRWLLIHHRGASRSPDGFVVTDEVQWSQSLQAAEGKEI